ncbi:MAG: hypothetical protein CMJ50_08465 [Planctomycetaceae bacterium]|nr:hypothetical protein [Planctomycetaceae bacterium]
MTSRRAYDQTLIDVRATSHFADVNLAANLPRFLANDGLGVITFASLLRLFSLIPLDNLR